VGFHYGKGPTKAKTHMVNDTVVFLRGGFTTVERTLLDTGEAGSVYQMFRGGCGFRGSASPLTRLRELRVPSTDLSSSSQASVSIGQNASPEMPALQTMRAS
jgi:Na+-translocating membrane potential-generating system (MpsC)